MLENPLRVVKVGEMVGNPPRENLIAAIQEAIQDPRQLRELESKVECLTAENQKTLEQLRKLEEERQELLKQVKEATIIVQKVSDVVGIPDDVWLKAKMFDAELKNVGYISGTKMVTFIMNQRNKMDASLKAMKALIVSCTELFPVVVGSSEDGKTSSSYSDLTPQDVVEFQGAAVGGGRHHGAHGPAYFRHGGSVFQCHSGFLHRWEGNLGWQSRGRGSTTQLANDLPCGF